MTRLLIIDHNAVSKSGRTLYAAIHQSGIADVAIVAPRIWREMGMVQKFERPEDGPPVHPLKVNFGGKHQRVMYRGLIPVLKATAPDIVLCNAEPENFLAYQIVHARKELGAAFKIALISWRNIDYRNVGYPYKLSLLHRMIEERILPCVDAIITHTSDARAIYEKYGYHHVTPIPPAVDSGAFSPGLESVEWSRSTSTIGFAGRFTALKGGDLLLQALPSLPQNCELLMIGSGECEQEWRALAQSNGVSERVHWKGNVPHDLMPAVLRSLDILVLPSRTGKLWKEQFGRILIEAMACGVAVVGSSSGEIPRVIGIDESVFPEGDAEALGTTLRTIIEDQRLRDGLVEQGLDRIASTYSVDAVTPLYRNLVTRLAGTGS